VQHLLGRHALGDVRLHPHIMRDLTVGVTHRGQGQLVVEEPPILAEVAQHHMAGLPLRDGIADRLHAWLILLGPLQEAAVGAQDFVAFIARDALERLVGIDDGLVGQGHRCNHHAVGRRGDRPVPQQKLLLGPLGIGGVAHDEGDDGFVIQLGPAGRHRHREGRALVAQA